MSHDCDGSHSWVQITELQGQLFRFVSAHNASRPPLGLVCKLKIFISVQNLGSKNVTCIVGKQSMTRAAHDHTLTLQPDSASRSRLRQQHSCLGTFQLPCSSCIPAQSQDPRHHLSLSATLTYVAQGQTQLLRLLPVQSFCNFWRWHGKVDF
jgi:hypothetical protein